MIGCKSKLLLINIKSHDLVQIAFEGDVNDEIQSVKFINKNLAICSVDNLLRLVDLEKQAI